MSISADDSLQGYTEAQKALVSKESAQMQPAVQKFNAVADSPKPAPPDQQKAPPAPNNDNFANDAQDWMTAMSAFSALAGAFSRGHATTALNSFAAGVNGFKQGNQQAFEDATKSWEGSNKAILENNKMLQDKYLEVLNERQLTEGEQTEKLKMIAAQYHDEMMFNSDTIAQKTKLMEIREQMAGRMEMARNKVQEKTDALKADIMTPDEVDYYAGLKNAGDKAAVGSATRGPAGQQNYNAILKRAAQLNNESGVTPQQQAMKDADYIAKTAGLKSVEQRGANVAMFADEAKNQFSILRKLSDELPRSEVKPISKMELDYENNTGSIPATKYITAIQASVNTYTKALAGAGVSTDAAKEHAYKILDQYGSDGQIQGALDIMTQEMQTAIDAPDNIRARIMGTEAKAPPSAAPAPSGAGWKIEPAE